MSGLRSIAYFDPAVTELMNSQYPAPRSRTAAFAGIHLAKVGNQDAPDPQVIDLAFKAVAVDQLKVLAIHLCRHCLDRPLRIQQYWSQRSFLLPDPAMDVIQRGICVPLGGPSVYLRNQSVVCEIDADIRRPVFRGRGNGNAIARN